MNANGRPRDSSCTCPSDYDPCKHIGIIADAIRAQTKQEKAAPKHSGLPKPEEVLSEISESELRQFFLSQLKENKTLRQNFYFKFAEKSRKSNDENPYSEILRKFFNTFSVGTDDDDSYYYSDMACSIDILDEWQDEIKKLIEGEEHEKAILICKAWIEEFSEWFSDLDENDQCNVDDSYANTPFEFLSEISKTGQADTAALYAYCANEMNAPKYDEGGMRDDFHNLLLELAKKTGNEDFIALQDKLLEETNDISVGDLEKILRRKIDFYNATKQPSRANEIINTNLHIEKFREIAVEKLIAAEKLSEAEALIDKYAPQDNTRHYGIDWNEKLLRIAQKENSIPKIRKISFKYITECFEKKHYKIYKSTFNTDEWSQEREHLLAHYRTKGGQVGGFVSTFYSTDSVAEFLLAENLSDRLLVHLTKNPSPNALEKYHTFLGKHYPEETLALFRKIVDDYTDKNVGQKHYEDIARWLRQMREIPGGAAVVNAMSTNYRLQYKRRTALIRELDKL
jgi:hypothetical protein